MPRQRGERRRRRCKGAFRVVHRAGIFLVAWALANISLLLLLYEVLLCSLNGGGGTAAVGATDRNRRDSGGCVAGAVGVAFHDS
jgi:hypothetical protein